MKALQREMAGLLSDETAKDVCLWFRANDYRIFGETIYPYHSGQQGPRWIYPLTNPDLFLSFARLGGGNRRFEEQVLLGWVRENGLLRRRDYSEGQYSDGTTEGEINQQSMTLRDFRSEVARANKMLTLLKQIRSGDYKALRARIDRKRIYVPDSIKESGYYGSKDIETSAALLVVDGEATEVEVLADEPPSDDRVHEWAAEALEYLVEQRLIRIGIIFTKNTWHPRPLSTMPGEVPYRPRLTLRCPDLESALWFQFASLIGDKRPLRECSECDETFVGPDRAHTCSDRCRQARSRRLRKKRGQ